MQRAVPDQRTEWLQKRWDWLAKFYDRTHLRPEWRAKICGRATGETLEVGAGTGLNLPYYPPDAHLTLVDLSPRMLESARRRASELDRQVAIEQMDIQHLGFQDGSFDTVIATCVFCTVPDPVQGLQEVRRVCRPDGQILLLEHVRSCGPVLGPLMDTLNPLTRRLTGTNINRRTVDNVRAAGLRVLSVTPLWRDVVLEIHAAP